jgi:hypothetical protein
MREHDKTSSPTTPRRARARPTSSTASPSPPPATASSRASPTGRTSTSSSTRPTPRRRWSTTTHPRRAPPQRAAQGRVVPAPRHRAVGGPRPGRARAHLRGVHARPGPREQGLHEVPPADRADQGGGLPARQEGRHAREGRRTAADAGAKFGHLGAIEFDEKQSIGKRYARMDEAGCPFCFTIDGDTLSRRHGDGARPRHAGAEPDPDGGGAGFLAEKLGL